MDGDNAGGGYELPSLEAVQTADDPVQAASEALHRLQAEWTTDDKHPYVNANHPQNRDFIERAHELHRIKTANDDQRPALEGVMEDALNAQAAGQAERIERADELIGEMAEYGYARPDEIPGDITAHEVLLLDVHLQCVKGQWPAALEQIETELTQLRAPPEIRRQFREHVEAEGDPDRLWHSQHVLRWLWDAGRARFGLPPRE